MAGANFHVVAFINGQAGGVARVNFYKGAGMEFVQRGHFAGLG